jgi:nitrous oxidase accessory protein NosD
MIHVTKRLTLESVGGAAVTIVDATGAAAAIRVSASGVVIGRRNRGFTFTGAGTEGLIAQSPVSGLHIEDNAFTANFANGISMNGDDHVVIGNVASHNINNAGFAIGGVASRGISVMNNVATGNRQAGFNLRGLQLRVMGNVAGDNQGTGFSVFWDGPDIVFTGNVSAGNEDKGFILGSGATVTGAVARRNAAIGNLRGGFFMAGNGVHVTQSNMFGNGTLPDVAGAGGLLNCGLITGLPTPVVADNNFWGSAAGPDFDPADQACTKGAGSVDFTPFATRPFTIVPGAGQ